MIKPLRFSFVVLVGTLAGACLLALLGWRLMWVAPVTNLPPTAAETASTRLVSMPSKVADGFYLIGHTFPAAVYVVETDDGLALIDSGLEAEYDKIVDAFPPLGLDPKRIKMILLTHAHGDHTMGAERLRRETGAKVYIGREDAAVLRQGGPWEAIFSTFDMPGVTLHPTTIDGELTDGQSLTLGEASITALATPGHTRGSFCYLIEHRAQRALFTGDTVMSLSDGLGTYSTYLPPRYRGNVDEYLRSLRKLGDLPAPDLVFPGHPQSDTVAQNPRLTSHQWKALVDRGITELEQLSERYARDGANFLDGTPKQLIEGLFYLGNMHGSAVYAVILNDVTLLFDAASGDDSSAFLEAAWKELGIEPPPVAAVLLTSCEAENLAGLRALVDATHCRVVASPAGIDTLPSHCPEAAPLATTEDLRVLGLPELTAMAAPGRDETAVAYRFRFGDAKVLVSGDVLVESDEVDVPQVFAALSGQTWDTDQLSASLKALEPVRPDLWLSAHPLHGRNANLYDFEWENTLSINRELLRRSRLMKKSPPAPALQ